MPSRSVSVGAVPPLSVPYPLLGRPVPLWCAHRSPAVPSERTSANTRSSTSSRGRAPAWANTVSYAAAAEVAAGGDDHGALRAVAPPPNASVDPFRTRSRLLSNRLPLLYTAWLPIW